MQSACVAPQPVVPTQALKRPAFLPASVALTPAVPLLRQPAVGPPALQATHQHRHHSRRQTRCACAGQAQSSGRARQPSHDQGEVHDAQPWPYQHEDDEEDEEDEDADYDEDEGEYGDDEDEDEQEAGDEISLEERMQMLMAQMGYSDDQPVLEDEQLRQKFEEQFIMPKERKAGQPDFDDLPAVDDEYLIEELGFTSEELAEQRALAGAAFTDPEGIDLTFDELGDVSDDAPPDLRAMVLDQRVYGPEAVLLAGFPPEELGIVRAVLDAAGGQELKVLPVSSEALYESIDQMIWSEEQDWSQARDLTVMQEALGAWGSQRTVLFSGLKIKTQATIVELLEGVGLEPLAVGMILEEDGPRRVGDVMADAVQAERQRRKMEKEGLAGRVARAYTTPAAPNTTGTTTRTSSSPAAEPGSSGGSSSPFSKKGFAERMVDQLPDLNEIWAMEMQKGRPSGESQVDDSALGSSAPGAESETDALLASLAGAPFVPPPPPTNTSFAPSGAPATPPSAGDTSSSTSSTSTTTLGTSAAAASPAASAAQTATVPPQSQATTPGATTAAADASASADPVTATLPAYENPLDELLSIPLDIPDLTNSTAAPVAPTPRSAATTPPPPAFNQTASIGSMLPTSENEPTGVLAQVQAALRQGMSPDDLKRLIDAAYAEQVGSPAPGAAPNNPSSSPDSSSTSSKPAAAAEPRPSRPFGPEPPPPPGMASPAQSPQDMQGLLNMKPEALSALTGKNITFVDLSKLPSKYRKQMAEQARARREALESGAPQQAAAAQRSDDATSGSQGSKEQQRGGAGSEAEDEEVRRWQREVLQQAQPTAPAASGSTGQTSSTRAKLLNRLYRMKQRGSGMGQGVTQQSEMQQQQGEMQQQQQSEVQQQGGDERQRVAGSGSSSDEEEPVVSSKRQITLPQLQQLLVAAQESGLDPQQMIAEALALGMVISPETAQAVGVRLPPASAVAAAKARLEQDLQDNGGAQGAAGKAGAAGQAGDVKRTRKRLGSLRRMTSGGRLRDLSVDIEEDGIEDTDEFESVVFEDGDGGYVQMNGDGTLDVEAIDLGDGAPGVVQGYDTLMGRTSAFTGGPAASASRAPTSPSVPSPPQAPEPAAPSTSGTSSSRAWGQGWARKPRGSSPASGSDFGIEVEKTGAPVIQATPVAASVLEDADDLTGGGKSPAGGSSRSREAPRVPAAGARAPGAAGSRGRAGGAGTSQPAPGAATMTREQLAAVAKRKGLDFETLLADARSKGIHIPDA